MTEARKLKLAAAVAVKHRVTGEVHAAMRANPALLQEWYDYWAVMEGMDDETFAKCVVELAVPDSGTTVPQLSTSPVQALPDPDSIQHTPEPETAVVVSVQPCVGYIPTTWKEMEQYLGVDRAEFTLMEKCLVDIAAWQKLGPVKTLAFRELREMIWKRHRAGKVVEE